ncbi:hypothetical protein ADIAL_1257 [Alkalibacterium sp. AK22]|uniref:hypothetical protein n=1 Tax=Alkalibacterium sp. AK22 TaxID=1229520 RepID=UPI00044CA4C7|nr:hypothetical protein [Alkalibacterium sp. AK22]EXJ23349.1 hypothetical protein ADIAL_1257 [Alkalibacterium sp. AK22]
MTQNTLNTIQEMEIKKAPEESTQEAANQLYTKKQLAYFIERHDLDIAKSWKKAEIVSALTEWMDAAAKELLKADADLQALLAQLTTEDSFDLYSDALSREQQESLRLLIEHGLVYNVDGSAWIPESAKSQATESPSISKEAADSNEAQKTAAPKSQETQTAQQTNAWSRPAQKAPALSTQEKIARNKQARLAYFKKQAKKKKRK